MGVRGRWYLVALNIKYGNDTEWKDTGKWVEEKVMWWLPQPGGAVKQKVKETETEDLAGRGLEKQHWERQSNPLLSFRHVVTVHYLDFK